VTEKHLPLNGLQSMRFVFSGKGETLRFEARKGRGELMKPETEGNLDPLSRAAGPLGHGYNQAIMTGSEIIFAVEDSIDGGYEARALGYSIVTQADTLEALRLMVRDAVHCHFEEAEMPAVIRLHFVRDEVISA
jgi:hypothetical protein